MKYIGGSRGAGLILCGGVSVARTKYDLDAYLSKDGQVTNCGEIRLPAAALKGLFGRGDIELRTDEGRLWKLRFSEKRLSSDDGTAHVDLIDELSAAVPMRRVAGHRAARL